MLKRISLAGLAIICVGGLIVWHGMMSKQRFQRDITKVHEGIDRNEVVQILGQPREARKPCVPAAQGCDQDFVYPVPLEMASFWTVSVDTSGHVINKFHWQSP